MTSLQEASAERDRPAVKTKLRRAWATDDHALAQREETHRTQMQIDAANEARANLMQWQALMSRGSSPLEIMPMPLPDWNEKPSA